MLCVPYGRSKEIATFVGNQNNKTMKKIFWTTCALCAVLLFSCDNDKKEAAPAEVAQAEDSDSFEYQIDQFADVKILRYQIPGWEDLSLDKQQLVYYLTQAGLEGRDIMWDQNYRHNLKIRKALENIYTNYSGDKNAANWKHFETYLKRVWFSNGIHHHYSNDKIKPEFNKEYLQELLSETKTTLEGEALEVIFNGEDAKKVNLNKDADIVLASAINFYGPDVTTADVESFYGAM